MNSDFWKEIPAYKDFKASFNIDAYTPFDPSWHLFVADIQGSTQVIQDGRYKDVNMVGAMSIVAVLNACPNIEIPFVFGGDGASLLVPETYVEKARLALLATKEKSKSDFSLHLRVGSISVQELSDKGIELLVAKHEISKDYKQAIFYGGGMSKADALIKGDASYCYDIPNHMPEVDFSGLECRWQDIPSPKEETLSLLVFANNPKTYNNLFAYITKHMGSYQQRNPVQEAGLHLSLSFTDLAHEAKAKAQGFKRYLLTKKLWLINILGIMLMKFDVRMDGGSWGKYKVQVSHTTDSEKFDDMLRMTFAANTHERIKLEKYLKTKHKKGELCYGMHISNRALMTCLVFERMGSQIHFVDAADGGYTMAAIGLKQQFKSLNEAIRAIV
ncbi:MAG: DUF3095 domain-containing protein [Mariprofundaceae bacterium]|nr:DUF3095 domain-containing protein [Mariprofundaceae bacterium]